MRSRQVSAFGENSPPVIAVPVGRGALLVSSRVESLWTVAGRVGCRRQPTKPESKQGAVLLCGSVRTTRTAVPVVTLSRRSRRSPVAASQLSHGVGPAGASVVGASVGSFASSGGDRVGTSSADMQMPRGGGKPLGCKLSSWGGSSNACSRSRARRSSVGARLFVEDRGGSTEVAQPSEEARVAEDASADDSSSVLRGAASW